MAFPVHNSGAKCGRDFDLEGVDGPLLRNPDDEPDKKAESNEEASHEEKTSQAFIGCAAQTGRND